MRLFLVKRYAKKRYPELDFHVEPSTSALTQRGAALLHQVVGIIVNNTDVVLKDSDISFSPNIIANGNVVYSPFKNFNLGVTAQYVGKQYLDNLETADNQLKDYLVPDFNMSYKLPFQKQEVTLRFLLNNFTNTKYVNNGFSGPYYFAQAGINFLFGVSLKLK